MAFESLTDKLQNVFKKLRSKGRLTEEDVKLALKEVKMALLEADVNFKVVKQFTKSVQEQAIGQDVMSGLNPGQMVIKIVNDELVKLMGSETTDLPLRPGNEITVFMMAGLQGAGKTTTVAKLAGKLKSKGKKPLLVACDVYRPAARNRAWKYSPWEINRSLWILQRQLLSMRKRTSRMSYLSIQPVVFMLMKI